MPNIPEYTNPIDGLRPSNEGIETASMAGRRIGSFYHQVGEDFQSLGATIQRHTDQQMLGDYTAQSAVHDLGYVQNEQAWLNAPQDPNNPSGPKNGEKPGAAIEYFHSFEASNDELVAHATKTASPEVRDKIIAHSAERMQALQRMAIGSQGELDHARSVNTINTVVNSAAATAYAGGDPDTILGLARSSLDNLTHSISQTDYAKAQEIQADGDKIMGYRVIKGAIDGAADAQTPEGIARARQLADDPKYDKYIGENRGAISNEIDAKEQHMQMQGRLNETQAEKTRRDNALQASDDAMRMIYKPDGTVSVPPDYISKVMSDPRFVGEPEARNFALSLAARDQKKDTTADDQAIYGNLVQLQIQGRLKTEDLLAANVATGGRLGEKTAAMNRELNNPPNSEKAAITLMKRSVLDGATNLIFPKTGLVDATTTIQKNRLAAYFETEYNRRTLQGDKPEELLDPSNSKYIFGGATLMRFGMPTDQELEYLQGTARPAPIAGDVARTRKDQFYWQSAQDKVPAAQTDANWAKFQKDHPDWATNPGGLSGGAGGGRPKLTQAQVDALFRGK